MTSDAFSCETFGRQPLGSSYPGVGEVVKCVETRFAERGWDVWAWAVG